MANRKPPVPTKRNKPEGDVLAPPRETGAPAPKPEPYRNADGTIDWDALTVSGKPIPEYMRHLVTYEKTDQGMAEANVGRQDRIVEVVRSEWDNTLLKRENATETWESPDPMVDAVNRVREPGMAYKFLSEPHIKRKGTRKYEFCREANGDPVKVGNLILGAMPEGLRDKRNRHYQQLGLDEVRNAEQQYRTEQVKALRDAGFSESDSLRPGEQVHDYTNPDRQATIGVRSTRGGDS